MDHCIIQWSMVQSMVGSICDLLALSSSVYLSVREAATRFSSCATAKLARCLRSDVGASEPSRERAARGASMFLPTIRTSEPSAAAAAAASVFPRESAKAHRIRSPSRRGEEEKPASSNGQLFCQQTRALLKLKILNKIKTLMMVEERKSLVECVIAIRIELSF